MAQKRVVVFNLLTLFHRHLLRLDIRPRSARLFALLFALNGRMHDGLNVRVDLGRVSKDFATQRSCKTIALTTFIGFVVLSCQISPSGHMLPTNSRLATANRQFWKASAKALAAAASGCAAVSKVGGGFSYSECFVSSARALKSHTTTHHVVWIGQTTRKTVHVHAEEELGGGVHCKLREQILG